MNEQNSKGRAPDFKGQGIDVWVNQDKNGKKFLSVVIMGNIRVTAFKNEPKQKEEKVEEVSMASLANSNEL